MPNYENETCAGCRFYPVIYDGDCRHPEMKSVAGWPDLRDRCDNFSPSYECRKVLALEEIARHPSHAAVILVNDKGELLAVPRSDQ